MENKFDVLVVGCGLVGSVVARRFAEIGKKVEIWERRDHIGGNMYDYIDDHGFLVHGYGPHVFHTSKKELYDYICRFGQWDEYIVRSGAVWDRKYTPTPFNFTTIDTFFDNEKAERLKRKLQDCFGGRKTATVLEVLRHDDDDIRSYAEYLFANDYAPYTAKQWGVSPETIDTSVLERVPLRFSYDDNFFDDTYQVLPRKSYTDFFVHLLCHQNIEYVLGVDALDRIQILNGSVMVDGEKADFPVVYTGALDELFGCIYGRLPYRSTRFEWKYKDVDSLQPAPLVAYPQENGYTRITEYKKLPLQKRHGTSYAVEYPLAYDGSTTTEPYYPVLTEESKRQYAKYRELADSILNLIPCGRLADYKYYNMDQALERAISIEIGSKKKNYE